MRGNRSRDTAPELAVRRLLHAQGLRFRVNLRPVASLRRTADVVFTRQRIAIFIDGCYWHGCPDHYVASKTNKEYWHAKIEANIARDEQTTAALITAGWTVLRYWSHVPPMEVADSITAHLPQPAAVPSTIPSAPQAVAGPQYPDQRVSEFESLEVPQLRR